MAARLHQRHSLDDGSERVSRAHSDDLDPDDFEDLYQRYSKPKKRPEDGDIEFTSEFEDVTQIATQWGSGDVFKTADKQGRDNHGRRRPWDRKFSNVSLLLRRILSFDRMTNEEVWSLQLEIQSAVLREAMKSIVKGFTSSSLEKDPIVIPEPFAELYFCRDQIQSAIEEAQSDELKQELQLLVTFRESYMAKTIKSIETSMKEGVIESIDLWCLFPIGSTIILQNRHTPGTTLIWCVVVKRCREKEKDNQKEPPVWEVDVEFSGFNGKQISRAERSFRIGGFHGYREIRSLAAYPLDLHPQKEKLQQTLIERGKRYVELCLDESREHKPREGYHCQYIGPFWSVENGGVNFFEKPTKQHDGRLIVDLAGKVLEDGQFEETIVPDTGGYAPAYMNRRPRMGERGRDNYVLGLDDLVETAGEEIPLEDLVTTPPTIAAYSLSLKTWGMVEIESLVPILWKDGTWDVLQLDTEKKAVVRGLIESHQESSSDFDDFIPGKGRGLVFLLYGPPGCGKTMTAESAAETLRRPLYYLSGAELGLLSGSQTHFNATYAGGADESVEAKLELIFKRIARWKALLLLDEADVFLTSRGESDNDGTRNALTSILLRMLEYQSGIIFLTTNRLLDFDKALFSRIHVTLSFEPLFPEQRRFIWEHMAKQTNHGFSDSDFVQLSLLPLDGRTIKNILRIASLHIKVRDQGKGGARTAVMSMSDVKAVLRFAVGGLDDEELEQKVDEFYGVTTGTIRKPLT